MAGAKKRILIVEDDRDIRDVLKELLGLNEYDVLMAENGQVGIDLLKLHGPGTSEPVDLVVVDLMMPIKDGFAFRREMLADPLLSGVPVIVMTADGRSQDKLDALAFSGFFRKPIELDEFLAGIAQVLNR